MLRRKCKTVAQFEGFPDNLLHWKFEERTRGGLVGKGTGHFAREIYRKCANILETDMLVCGLLLQGHGQTFQTYQQQV